MRKIGLCLLVLLLVSTALAEPEELSEKELQRIACLKNYLTEIEGYTQEEADRMIIQVQGSRSEDWEGRASDPDIPEMVYTVRLTGAANETYYMTESGEAVWITNPLDGMPENLIRWNTSTVRAGLRLAIKNQWFQDCSGANRAELLDWLTATSRLSWMTQAALERGNLKSDEAVHLFFTACFGERWSWNAAVQAWEQAVMRACGQMHTCPYLPELGTTFHCVRMNGKNSDSRTVFGAEWPDKGTEDLEKSPALKDRPLVCGMVEMNGQAGAQALLVVQDQGKRVLVHANRGRLQDTWTICPCGEDCLVQTGKIDVVPSRSSNDYTVRMEEGEGRQVHIRLGFWGRPSDGCFLREIRILEEEGEKTTVMTDGKASVYVRGKLQETKPVQLPPYLEYLTWETIRSPESDPMEETENRWATIGEVHFRQDHSSHSTDLGMLTQGAVFEVLDTEPGTEAAWLHARVGELTGWVSSTYASRSGNKSMPVAAGRKAVGMYASTGLFARKVAEIAPGEPVWILLRRGSWLYVLRPDGSVTWPAEMQGTYGWVHAGDVTEAATPMNLKWQE